MRKHSMLEENLSVVCLSQDFSSPARVFNSNLFSFYLIINPQAAYLNGYLIFAVFILGASKANKAADKPTDPPTLAKSPL